VDVIFLLILSALTSGPLVIQRQVETLGHYFDMDVQVDVIQFGLSLGVLITAIFILLLVVVNQPFSPDEEIAAEMVVQTMHLFFIMVPVVVIPLLVIWLCKGCPSPPTCASVWGVEEVGEEEEGEGKVVDPMRISEASHVSMINSVALNAASASATSSSSSNPFPGHAQQEPSSSSSDVYTSSQRIGIDTFLTRSNSSSNSSSSEPKTEGMASYDVLPHAINQLCAKGYKFVTVARRLGQALYENVGAPAACTSWA
jgi:hypothetical protein